MLDDQMLQEIAAEAETADWQEHIGAALSKPTVSSLSALNTFPQRMEGIQEALGGYSPGRVGQNLQDAVAVANALNVGKPRLAVDLLAQRRAAFRASERSAGNRDGSAQQADRWGTSTEITDMLLGHVRSGEPERLEQAKGIAGMVIALSLDPEDVPQVLARAGFKDDRTAAEKRQAARRIAIDRGAA